MKVRTKLIIGFTTVVVLLWIIIFYAVNNMGSLKQQFVAVEEDIIPNTLKITEIEQIANEAYHQTVNYVLLDIPESKTKSQAEIQKLKELSKEYLPDATSVSSLEYSDNQEFMAMINNLAINLSNTIVTKEGGAGYDELFPLHRNTNTPALLDLEQLINEKKTNSIAQLSTIDEEYSQAHANVNQALWYSAGLITLIALVTTYLTTRSVVLPLHALHKGTEMIARGNLNYRVGTNAKDEIGQLSRAFDDMSTSLNESMTSIDVLNEEIAEREKAEEALRESEERYRDLFDNTGEIIQSISPQGNFVYVNQAWRNSLGYDDDEIRELNFQDIIHPESISHCNEIFQKLMSGEAVPRIETTFISKDGNIIRVEGDISVQRKNGVIIATRGIFHDITDREKVRKALSQEASWRRIMVEQSRDGIVVLDGHGKAYEANRQFGEILGYSPEEVLQLHVWDWDAQHTPDEIMEMIRNVDEDGDHFETGWQRKDGTNVDVEISTNGTMFGGQKFVFCVCRDTTERKSMEEALKTREERFSDLADNTLEWIWEIDTDGKYTYSSPVIEKILGYTPEEIIGKHFYDLFHPEDKNKLKKAAFKAFAQKQPFHDFVNRNIHKNGRTIVLSTSGVPILDADGNLLGYRGVDTDITERKKRDQLQQDENYVLTLLGQGAELGELLDAIVHLGEDNDSSIKGSILLYDPDKNWLNVGSGPNLPEGYSKLMESGIPIGDNMGSCGTAAYRKERVIVPDIAESPFFKPLEEVVNAAVGNNLLACWSQHILSSNGDLLGTIANYSDKIGEPNADNIKLLEWSARIAAIAIERKQAEEALQESEDKFSKAFRSSPNTIVITTLKEGRFIEVNDSFTELTGYTREEVIGQSAKDLHIWADTKDRDKMLKILKRDGRVRDEEFKFRIKSGEIRTWSFSAELIDIKNEPHMISMTIDITELKRAEQATKDSEEKFSKAFHSSPAAISISLLDDGSFIEVNDSYTRITGHSREELIGHNAGDFNIWVNTKEKNRMLDKISNRQKITNEEFDYRLKSGEIRTMLVSNEYLTLNGKPCVLVANTDITERKRTEEKLKNTLADLENSSTKLAATNKELETFSYSVSHDLRSPLRSIDGFSQALLEDYQERLDDTGKDYLQRLRSASQKMGELIDGILKLSRLNRGEMHKEEIDLSALVGEISARLQENEPQRHAKFLIKKGLVTQGDPQLLRALIENLIGNSWKFTRKCKETKIEFGTSKNGGETTYFIKDNGAGFDMTYADKLFGAFQRLHDVSEYPGTGIGLATVQRIINRHGGNIWAEGAVDKGATFYFTLN